MLMLFFMLTNKHLNRFEVDLDSHQKSIKNYAKMNLYTYLKVIGLEFFLQTYHNSIYANFYE